jgi:hypothetical protein
MLNLFVHLIMHSISCSVAEPHHFDADPAWGKSFDAAPAPALQYSKGEFLKRV